MKFYALFATAFAALALVAVMAGCSPMPSTGTEEPVNLDGTSWTLIRLQDQDPIADTQATLAFEGDQVSGTASCNRYFGSVTLKDDTLTFGAIGSTEMWCATPEGVMDQEADYLKALGAAARYNVENDQLTLLDASGQALLVFGAGTD